MPIDLRITTVKVGIGAAPRRLFEKDNRQSYFYLSPNPAKFSAGLLGKVTCLQASLMTTRAST